MFPWEAEPQEHYLFGTLKVTVIRGGKAVPDYTVGIADDADIASRKG